MALLIAAATALMLGWSTISPVATAHAAPVTVSGIVTDAAGAPLSDILVELAGQVPYRPAVSYRTGADGRYTLSDVAPGTFHLSLDDRGSRGDALNFASAWRTVVVQDGIPRTIDVTLQRNGLVVGSVVEATSGEPVVHTSLAATTGSGMELAWTTTDAVARYAVQVPPGPVRIRPGGSSPYIAAGDRTGVLVEARSGEEVEAPLLSLLRGAVVTGRVVDADTGAPLPGVTVAAGWGVGTVPVGPFGTVQTDADGRYEMGLRGEEDAILTVTGPWYTASQDYAEPRGVPLTTAWEGAYEIDFALHVDGDGDGVSDDDEARLSSDPSVPEAFPMTRRFGGADRFEVAVSISELMTEPGSPLFLVSGRTFPDALAAGPAAASVGGGVLLVQPDALPDAVVEEIRRVRPSEIVVIGGPRSVSDAVLAQAGALAGVAPTRIGGADRFAVAVNVADAFFPGHQDTVLLANGQSFPDALGLASAGSMPGAEAPVLLTTPASLPAGVQAALQRMDPNEVVVAGGVRSVEEPQMASIRAAAGVAPQRIDGADRYAVSAGIAAYFAPEVVTVPAVFASGSTFPDALAGSMITARTGAPLLLTTPQCLYTFGIDPRIGATYRYVAGGPASVAEGAIDRYC
ncbi:cell wall-binding repeat-containing protein [Agrococcus versicolor]|uniref:cell wall-binding repeat-containing protein n=1 Tax=Agrococcus versicolor TaxID=501482 RepID=UPI0031E29E69